jgi:hypothetical protein
MPKVVVNRCFGGFSLSAFGVRRYLELKGITAVCYLRKGDLHERIDDDINLYPEGNLQEFDVFTKNVGKLVTYNQLAEYSSPNRDIPRDDPDLVRVVEELGEKANGRCANLAVVDVPDDVSWYIDEYDGSESVEERHRSW